MELFDDELVRTSNTNENFNFKKNISEILHFWYLFLISVIICGSLAYFYSNYSSPTYKINSKITIEDKSSPGGGKSLGSNSNVDFSDLLGTPNNAFNEMEVLTSKFLMTSVVKDLHLNVTIYQKQNIKSIELFNQAPFNVQVIAKNDSMSPRLFTVKLNGNFIQIKNSDENLDKTIRFGQLLQCQQFALIFTKKPGYISPKGYKILVQSVDNKVDDLASRFTVDLTDKKSTTLALTLDYPVPDKGEVILQKLMDLYLKLNLQVKQSIADSTITFIDNRLKIVGTQLEGIETKFTEFKQNNNIANVDEQGKALVGDVSEYYKKLSDQELQLQVVNDVSQFINNPANNKIIPASLGMQDESFGNAVAAYNQLLAQKAQLSLSYKDDNPVIKNLDSEIESVRQNLIKSISTYKSGLVIGINALKSQNASLNSQVKNVPQKQRTFLDYSRQQDLKEQLYLLLLQKREETAISRTSTISTARIIDPAKSDSVPFKPKKGIILIVGFGLGLILPWLFLYFKSLLNVKILSKDDVVNHTKAVIVGEIGFNKEGNNLIVSQNSRSGLSEQFRALRTNLQFVLKSDNTCNIIMITSSMSGEGKSFITLNLGAILALTGKKVVIMELDLRKPKIAVNAGVSQGSGYSNYAISNSLSSADIIQPVPGLENVFIIPSGPVPPNPAELLLSQRLGNLMNDLKKEFDYILIDSAPIGLVSDAQLIERYTDVNLFVARQNYTLKSQLDIVNDLTSSGKFKPTYLVINDIRLSKTGYYSYGYNSGYGYGYGYGE